MKEIHEEYGYFFMEERDYRFSAAKKQEIMTRIMENKELPSLPYAVTKVSYLDGCKVYFENGGWIIARFSGTEPLLRIFCEMPEKEEAATLCRLYETWLGV